MLDDIAWLSIADLIQVLLHSLSCVMARAHDLPVVYRGGGLLILEFRAL